MASVIQFDEIENSKKIQPILLTNVCMSQKVWDQSGTMVKRAEIFSHYLPNSSEYVITDMNDSQNCKTCDDFENIDDQMKEADYKCKTKTKGYNAFYKRIKYLGNKKICCLRKDQFDDKVDRDNNYNVVEKKLTCHPDFVRHGSTACRPQRS